LAVSLGTIWGISMSIGAMLRRVFLEGESSPGAEKKEGKK
jgi:hypothetical protein